MTGITRREILCLLGATATAFAVKTSISWGAEPPKTGSPLTRKIPSSGEALPVIGLGSARTFNVGSSEQKHAPLREVLKAFVDLGGNVVDSSPMYGRSETVIGDLAAELSLHNRLFLATKVWTTGREAGIRQMEDSFRKLRVKTLDLMQVHNLVDMETHLKTLHEWKASGRIRYLGITHSRASGHGEVAKIMAAYPLDFVQINYSVGERESEKRILPLAQERGIAVIINRPFSGGDLFSRLRKKPLPSWASEIDCTSWAQILLKFVVSHPAVTCAIPATSKVDHLRDNMEAGLGRLPNAKLREKITMEAA